MKPEKKEEQGHKYTPVQRIAAMAGVLLLAGLYVLTFISSLLNAPWAGRLFRLCLGMTIVVPVFLWIAIWAVGRMTGRHTMASPDILQSDPGERRRTEEALRQEDAVLPEAEEGGESSGS